MIDITQLLKASDNEATSIRYSKKCKNATHGVSEHMGPVVAWNITQSCNLKCQHCYSSAVSSSKNELSLEQIKETIDQLAALKVPVILLSGGEPFMHPHLIDIITYIRDKGIRVSLSTNGTLITHDVAKQMKELGVSYIGISLDGLEALNDSFRGVSGAYAKSLKGIENCRAVGQKVGLRMTIHKENIHQVPSILELMEKEDIHRICFYHLVPSGRGEGIKDMMLTDEQARTFMDRISAYALDAQTKGIDKEVLTVTNHTDGPYLYLKQKEKDPEQAVLLYEKLSRNKGNRSGIAIMNIDWNGNVFPDQFSRFMPLGNVLEASLEDIWIKGNDALNALRNKRDYLPDKCQTCRWIDICGGNLRARAYSVTGDLWGEDPGCYLKEDER